MFVAYQHSLPLQKLCTDREGRQKRHFKFVVVKNFDNIFGISFLAK